MVRMLENRFAVVELLILASRVDTMGKGETTNAIVAHSNGAIKIMTDLPAMIGVMTTVVVYDSPRYCLDVTPRAGLLQAYDERC